MDNETWVALQPVLRNLCSIIAGALISRGLVQAGQTELIVGTMMGLAAAVWSFYTHQMGQAKVNAALQLPAGATKEDLNQALNQPSSQG